MEYKGKLYAKIGNKYLEISHTDEFESLEALVAGSQLQPPVISAEAFLKEEQDWLNSRNLNSKGNFEFCEKELIEFLADYLQRQGQKTNQTKL